MKANLIDYNYNTRYAKFVISNIDALSLLPTTTSSGKGNLSTIYGISIGSVCKVLSNPIRYYVLNENDEWIENKLESPEFNIANENTIKSLFE